MTPHQKAIEAAAKAVEKVTWATIYREEMETIIAAYLTSAIKSGWELKPRELEAPFYGATWLTMFDAAPRFEDAP